MEQNQRPKLSERWEQLQPTKQALVWSCVGAVAATIVIGFTLGGWVTGGTANQMANSAADEARAELAAAICVENFLANADVGTQLTELKGIDSTFRQRQFIEGGGWATMPGMESANRQAADACARTLAEIELDAVAGTAGRDMEDL